jgi:hypothetical protein
MAETVFARVLLAITFAIYIYAYLAMRRRPVRIYEDEIVNYSGVTAFRDMVTHPYIFNFFPVMHALHRRIMAMVPRSQEIEAGRLLNMACILIHSLGMYLLISRYYDTSIAMLATSWWMLSGWGLGLHVGRLCNYTERALGDVLVFTGFAGLILLAEQETWLRIAVVAALWAPVWHSSKFGVQAIVVIGLVGAIALQDASLAIAMVASALLAFVVFGPIVITQMRDQIGHLVWYWRSGMNYLKHSDGPEKTLRQKIVALLIRQKFCSHALIYLPTLPLIVLALIPGISRSWSHGESLALVCIFVAGLTLLGRLVVIGPAARYAYILLPFLLARLLVTWPEVAWVLAAVEISYGVGVGAVYLRRFRNQKDTSTARIAGLTKLLASCSDYGPSRMVCDPLRIGEMIQAADPPPRLKFVTFGFTRANVKFVERYYPLFPHLSIDRAGVRALELEVAIDGALLDLKSSEPSVRKAFQKEGFVPFDETEQFLLLWKPAASPTREALSREG